MAVWLYGEQLTVAFADEALAEYQVSSQPDRRQLSAIVETQLFHTPFRSPQLSLWDRDEVEWFSVIRVPPYARRRRHDVSEGQQSRLFPEDEPAIVAS